MDSLIISVFPVELNTTRIVAGSVTVRPVLSIQLEKSVSVVISVRIEPPIVYLGEPQSLQLLVLPRTNDYFRGPPQNRRVVSRPQCPLIFTFDFVASTDSPSVFNISHPLDISYNSHRV